MTLGDKFRNATDKPDDVKSDDDVLGNDKSKQRDRRDKRDRDLGPKPPWETGEHKNYDPTEDPPNSPADSHYV